MKMEFGGPMYCWDESMKLTKHVVVGEGKKKKRYTDKVNKNHRDCYYFFCASCSEQLYFSCFLAKGDKEPLTTETTEHSGTESDSKPGGGS